MNRRSFLKRLLGAAGAVAAGPVALDVAKAILPATAPSVNPAWVNAEFEASFVIPSQEYIDWLVGRTAWYWNDLTLKNLQKAMPEVADSLCVIPYGGQHE